MFDNFPKTRKPLPSEYQKIYESFYKSNRNGETTASGAAQKMERWLHRKVANDTQGISGYKTLEIGAGTLNQLSYEKDFRHYDIIEPFAALYKDSANLSKIHKIYNDMSEIVDEFHIMNEFADNNSNGGGGFHFTIETFLVRFWSISWICLLLWQMLVCYCKMMVCFQLQYHRKAGFFGHLATKQPQDLNFV